MNDNCAVKFTWTGRLQCNLPPTFLGLFCSLQHLIRVKICWKSLETGEIGCTQSELGFKVLAHPLQLQSKENKFILGILDDAAVPDQDIDDLFPDDLKFVENETELISKILECKQRESLDLAHAHTLKGDCDEIVREIVESDPGYKRSLSVELADGQSFNIGSLCLRKITLIPGSQIFLSLDLMSPGQIESIQLRLECLESYSQEFLVSNHQAVWEDVVKEMKVIPGCRDRLDLILAIPPNLLATNSCPLFDLKWQLGVSFFFDRRSFDLKIPLRLISLKFRVNKL